LVKERAPRSQLTRTKEHGSHQAARPRARIRLAALDVAACGRRLPDPNLSRAGGIIGLAFFHASPAQHARGRQTVDKVNGNSSRPDPSGPIEHFVVLKQKITMHYFPPSVIYGCLLVLNGRCYRVTKVFRSPPSGFAMSNSEYEGHLQCCHFDPQIAQIFKYGKRRFLLLHHSWLQHSHRGAIHAYAEIRRFGLHPGPDRWLRVGLDFPRIPSAEFATRVRVPWQRRRSQLPCHLDSPPGPPSISIPLEVEELLVDPPVVQQ
jgi:hypothetical protein